MRFTCIAAAAMATTASAQKDGAEQPPAEAPVLGSITSQGCFSAKVGEKADVRASSVSSGQCAQACEDGGFTVAVTGGQACYCANEYPPKDALADDENCDYMCPAYPLEACGGLGDDGYFSVRNLGVEVNVPNAEGGDDTDDGEEDTPKDDSKEDNGEKEDGKEDNGEEDQDDDEHHSPTALWTASQTPSGTTTVTTSVSATPTGNDSDDNSDDDNDDSQSTSATASPTPVQSDPPEDAAAGLALNMATVAGALAVVAAAF